MTDTANLRNRFHLVELGDVGSTNDEARVRQDLLADTDFVVTGVRQISGRGRRGRDWVSPAGNLYASFVLRPALDLHRLPELSFVAALSVALSVREILGDRGHVSCKWPNDVLVDGAKVCGILLETARGQDGRTAVIIGIGVNVASHPTGTPYGAIALSSLVPETGVERVRAMLSHNLTIWSETWERRGFQPVREAWLELADGIGEPVVARLPDRELTGIFDGLGDDGALLLRADDGSVTRVTAGEVFRQTMQT